MEDDKRIRTLTLHPATRLMAWLLLLLAVQCLSGVALAAAFLFVPVLGKKVLRRSAKLIWRARWLLATLLLVFSWAVAGTPLWDGPAAPTQEGLQEALSHLGRLLLVLVAVAAFLETMPLADLLAATHAWLKPLRYFGIDPDRGVVRLMLVLRYVETLPRPRDWRRLLDAPAESVSERLAVVDHPLHWPDYFIALSCTVAVTVLYLR
jgi:energy-coupling factor transporter transmembrane protein EcfT